MFASLWAAFKQHLLSMEVLASVGMFQTTINRILDWFSENRSVYWGLYENPSTILVRIYYAGADLKQSNSSAHLFNCVLGVWGLASVCHPKKSSNHSKNVFEKLGLHFSAGAERSCDYWSIL